jgi:hypothetical protein
VGNINVLSQLKNLKVLVHNLLLISPIKEILPHNCQILVWPSGIDTDYWQKKKSDLHVFEVLIYIKNLNDIENLRCAENYLRKRKINFTVLEYGSYSQSDFRSILNRVSAAIWIGETESQGLALLESWAMNVPTLVLKKETWYNADGQPYPASSAPYMSHTMGQFSNSSEYSEDDFKKFFSSLEDFSPRKSVQQSFDLDICASFLLKLLDE